MKKFSTLLIFILIVTACKKRENDLSVYEIKNQSFIFKNGSSEVIIDKGSLDNEYRFACKEFTFSTYYYPHYLDLDSNYYIVHSEKTFEIRSNKEFLLKPAHVKISYFKCTNTSVPCYINHNDLKPYKLMVNENYNYYSTKTFIPVQNYTIDSINQTINFHDSQVNCVYVIFRKS